MRQHGSSLEAWPEEQRARALQMLVHSCDIGNPAKSLHSSLLWSERILAENFAQVPQAFTKPGTCQVDNRLSLHPDARVSGQKLSAPAGSHA